VWYLFIFTVASSMVSSFPDIATAHDYRWGRTDASVAEPGAYLIALILTPLFILFVWWLLYAASEHPPVKPRSRRVRTHSSCHEAAAPGSRVAHSKVLLASRKNWSNYQTCLIIALRHVRGYH
jgi:hypothetical protein